MHPEKQHLLLKQTGSTTIFHSDTSPALGHVLVHSVDKTHVLVVTVEMIWLFLNILSFNFILIPNKSLRFTKFRRGCVNRAAVLLTNHCHSYTDFLKNDIFSQSPSRRRGDFGMFSHSITLISRFSDFISKPEISRNRPVEKHFFFVTGRVINENYYPKRMYFLSFCVWYVFLNG